MRFAAENGEVLRTSRSAVAHWVAGTAPGERTAAYVAEALIQPNRQPLGRSPQFREKGSSVMRSSPPQCQPVPDPKGRDDDYQKQ